MTALRGITWDHPRGYQPLFAAANCWEQQTGVRIEWSVRTLKDFGDMPVEMLVASNDLLILDHPYMGEAHANGLLVSLSDFLEKEFLYVQQQQSVGQSFESYRYAGSHYALPIDAAAQVAVARQDLMQLTGWEPPRNTTDIARSAASLPSSYTMAVPLCPVDIWCVFLTLCAQYANGRVFSESGIIGEPATWALEEIRGWRSFLHQDSFRMNPITLLEQMTSGDEIIYCPFAFGYTNYSRKGFCQKIVQFTEAPTLREGEMSTILGGAGIAVSAKTKALRECIAFIKYIVEPNIQKTIYYENGGQPAALDAWNDDACNKDCNDFFRNTIKTMKHAYVRPRIPGFNRFQEKASLMVHELVLNTSPVQKGIEQLNNLFYLLCHE